MSVGRWFPPLRHMGVANLVTSLGATAAFLAICAAVSGHGRVALTLLALSLAADRLDGPVARARGEQSAFGVQMDSLSDQVAFALTPALIAFAEHLVPVAALPLLALYVLAGMWRLAHFNVTGLSESAEGAWFAGQPTTDTAAWFLVLAVIVRFLPPAAATIVMLALFATGSVLMLSGLRYPKNGLPQRILTVLVPLSVLALWLV